MCALGYHCLRDASPCTVWRARTRYVLFEGKQHAFHASSALVFLPSVLVSTSMTRRLTNIHAFSIDVLCIDCIAPHLGETMSLPVCIGTMTGTYQEICKFAQEKFGATFTLFDPINVNGPQTHPVYQWLKANNPEDAPCRR